MCDQSGHLQILRHLWVIATSNRILVPRDIDTGKACLLPIKITNLQGETFQDVAPTLVQRGDLIESCSKRYWNQQKDTLSTTTILWVKRKKCFFDYTKVKDYLINHSLMNYPLGS